jgi:hypothetical protein
LVIAVGSLWVMGGERADAQMTVFVAGGGLVPLGGLADIAHLGPLAIGGVSMRIGGSPLSVGAEGLYGRSNHLTAGDRSDIYGASAVVSVALYEVELVTVRLSGGVGEATHAHHSTAYPGLEASRTGLTAGGGGTVAVRFDGVEAFLRAQYMRGLGGLDTRAFPTELMGAALGAAFPVG